MRERLLRAPAWQLAVLTGGSFGLLMALNHRVVQGDSWTRALVTGLVTGVFFGAFMGPFSARMNRRVLAAASGLPPGHVLRAVRLARRGPVPEDPALRSAARRIALDQRDQMLRQRPWLLPLVGLPLLLLLVLALSDGGGPPVVWLAIVLLPGAVAAHLLMARHLGQRAELLAGPPD